MSAEGFAIDAGMLPELLRVKTFLVKVNPAEGQSAGNLVFNNYYPKPAPDLLPSTEDQCNHTLSVDDAHLEAALSGDVVHMLLTGEHYELLYPNAAQWAKKEHCMRRGVKSGGKEVLPALMPSDSS
jgi:hypothetical protein